MIYDNHLHLQPDGKNVEAVKLFQRAGGTHINVCPVPDTTINFDAEYYEKIYSKLLKLVEVIRKNTTVTIYVTIGPYPVDLVRAEQEGMSLDKAFMLMKKGVDLAAKLITEQKAIAIGEVGRPHFPVSQAVWKRSNLLLEYVFEKAKDVDTSVVLHTEHPTREVFEELAMMADKAHLRRERVIKHHSPLFLDKMHNFGLFPSILATRKNVREVFKNGSRFFLETDYIDDITRPNIVLPITSVPKRVKMAINERLITQDKLDKITAQNLKTAYNIDL